MGLFLRNPCLQFSSKCCYFKASSSSSPNPICLPPQAIPFHPFNPTKLLSSMPKMKQQRKAVQIVVYVVKAKRTKHATSHDHRPGRHHYHPLLRHSAGGGDRKAQLLMYTREMRALACREKAPCLHMVEQNVHKEVVQITSHHKTQQKSKKPAVVQTKEKFLQITAAKKPQKKPSWMVVPMEDRPAQSPTELSHPSTSCFGDCKKTLFPCFLARTFGGLQVDKDKDKKRRKKKKPAVSIRDKMNVVMMSSRMKKERIGVMAKILSIFGKHP